MGWVLAAFLIGLISGVTLIAFLAFEDYNELKELRMEKRVREAKSEHEP